MDTLLNVSESRLIVEVQDDVPIVSVEPAKLKSLPKDKSLKAQFDNANELLSVLQNEPSFETLHSCLKWLVRHEDDFNIQVPGPVSTQIIGTLVSEIVPSYWTILCEDDHRREKQWLLRCLTSVSGLAALVARLKFFRSSDSGTSSSGQSSKSNSGEALDVLASILHGHLLLLNLWSDIQKYISKPIQQQLLWKESISLLASGRLLSVAAETLTILEDRESQSSWLGDGTAFTKWLGNNIRKLGLSREEHGVEILDPAAQMLGRAFSLGQHDALVDASFHGFMSGHAKELDAELELFDHLNTMDRTKSFAAVLSVLNKRFISTSKSSHQKLISGSAALIKRLVDRSPSLQGYLINWLACVSGGCVSSELSIRRSAICVLSAYENSTEEALRQLLIQFGDKIHIQHAPVMVQEVCTQNLLLLVGRLFRMDKAILKSIARSSIFINAISNRLDSSSERPRFLGMVTGTAVSELIDDADKRMKFTDVLRGSDTSWYLELTGVQDRIGQLSDLAAKDERQLTADSVLPTKKKPLRTIKAPSTLRTSKIVSIQEISSDEDDIPRYQKPDSDAEDSDEDPTLINRNKPTPPVYIRDLLAYLRDTDNFDRHVLAMSHASSLIRRKSSYGTEVADHVEDLASLLCGLKDEHDIESWQEQRIAALVAIILAQPTSMGKWFANMVFSGDYSMSQRATMLTSITLAARELAGYASEDAELTKAPDPSELLFPSKQLPAKYEKLYQQSTSAITSAARDLENKMLQPLAAEALDKTNTAPSILKTRTFSSRLAVESRKKPINNKLSTLLSEHFFFPLTNRWRIYTLTHSSGPGHGNVFQTPFLQAHLLKTLSLLLAAAGSSSLSLPALTNEFWSILLSPSTRTLASTAMPVLEAVLFGLLTLLDINSAGIEGEDRSKRRLAEECGEQLVETRAWVGVVMEGFAGRSKGLGREEERIRMLAAGVLIRVEEVVDRYQRLLMGVLAGV